ncbi:MAG: hypothetical protein ACO1SV_27075 [Fimbriimonas sp.]
MPYTLKPKFEQYRTQTIRAGQPMREKDVVPIQAALETALGLVPDLLIEKVRRLPRDEAMLDLSCRWLGMDSSQDDVVRTLKRSFPEDVMELENVQYWVGPQDELVILTFAGQREKRFLTGRVQVNF